MIIWSLSQLCHWGLTSVDPGLYSLFRQKVQDRSSWYVPFLLFPTRDTRDRSLFGIRVRTVPLIPSWGKIERECQTRSRPFPFIVSVSGPRSRQRVLYGSERSQGSPVTDRDRRTCPDPDGTGNKQLRVRTVPLRQDLSLCLLLNSDQQGPRVRLYGRLSHRRTSCERGGRSRDTIK